MQSAAHYNAERAHRFGYRGSAAHRPRRTVEGRHEAVAEVLDLAPAKPLQLLPHRLVVAIEQRAPLPVAKLGGAPRRIDDVGEHDRREHPVHILLAARPGEELLDLIDKAVTVADKH